MMVTDTGIYSFSTEMFRYTGVAGQIRKHLFYTRPERCEKRYRLKERTHFIHKL